MIHDSVENIDAFVEKYIYEYRGFLFRIHTWRQIELLSVWFAGILAALGASAHYLSFGFTESVYQYIAAGVAEVVLLSVVIRLTDEPYKINAVKMYMVDYLENICALRLRKQRQTDRDEISVIATDSTQKPCFRMRHRVDLRMYPRVRHSLRRSPLRNRSRSSGKKRNCLSILKESRGMLKKVKRRDRLCEGQ